MWLHLFYENVYISGQVFVFLEPKLWIRPKEEGMCDGRPFTVARGSGWLPASALIPLGVFWKADSIRPRTSERASERQQLFAEDNGIQCQLNNADRSAGRHRNREGGARK